MSGLLLKDFYLLKKYCRAYAVIVAVFIIVSFINPENLLFFFYPCVFSGLAPVTLISYDEREKWTVYAGTLPVTRAQMVSSKYWISLIMGGIVMALMIAGQTAARIRNGGLGPDYAVTVVGMISVILLVPAFVLPFVFRLGAEKGRIAYIVVLVVAAACIGGLFGLSDIRMFPAGSAGAGWAVPVLLAVAAAFVVSWRLSIRIYEKKEL